MGNTAFADHLNWVSFQSRVKAVLAEAMGLPRLVRCRHTHAKWVFGKTYCPDCGVGLVFRWIALRCAHCQQPRQSAVRQGSVRPANNCCTFCGERAVTSEDIQDPQYFHLHYATLVLREEVRDGDYSGTGLENLPARALDDFRLAEPRLLESGEFAGGL